MYMEKDNMEKDNMKKEEKVVNIFAMFGEFLIKILKNVVDYTDLALEPLKNMKTNTSPSLVIRWITFVAYVTLAFIFYFKNPYNVMGVARGWGILVMIGLGGILLAICLGKNMNTLTNIIDNLKLLGKLIAVILGFFILSMILFKAIININFLVQGVKGLLNVFIVIFCMCLVYLLFKEQITGNKQSLIFKIISKIIFYIPCLIIDIIEFLKKDYSATPKVSFIIFGLLVLFIFISILIPKIAKWQTTLDGIVLLPKPVYLNNKHSLITQKELDEKIHANPKDKADDGVLYAYNRFFFTNPSEGFDGNRTYGKDDHAENIYGLKDEWGTTVDPVTKKWNSMKVYDYDTNRFIFVTKDNSMNYKVNKDLWRNMMKHNKSLAETLVDFMENPKTLNEEYKKQFNKMLESKYTPEFIKKLNTFIKNNHQEIKDSISEYNKNTIKPYMTYHHDNHKLDYNFAISMWVFIDDHGIETNSSYTQYTPLFDYGNKPTLLYYGIKNELLIQTISCMNTIDGKKCKPNTSFRTNKILYQRWNHIVMNYTGGTLDIFINNHLVGTAINVIPYMESDTISVGSENGIHGGISNVVYYKKPLTKSTIGIIYNLFKNDNPPVFSYSNK